MSTIIKPVNRERTFLIDELFFSTTNLKGIIETGNDVFVRVSGHPIESLIGAPHNIIRHPDMPRAVFRLLWDYLEAGKSFAGYVKNMARDGSYYWVMALLVPKEKGYLSVRFKPSGPYFAAAREIYAEMLALENAGLDAERAGAKAVDWRERMTRAGERMTELLRAKGFESYDRFMQTAIADEMTARRAQLGAKARPAAGGTAAANTSADENLLAAERLFVGVDERLDDLFAHVASLLDLVDRLNQRSLQLNSLSRDIKTVSLNGVIASNRLGEAGRGLSVVTQALTSVSGESTASIARISVELGALGALTHELAFAITAAKLQAEMTLFFIREIAAGEGGGQTSATIQSDIETLRRTLAQSLEKIIAMMPSASAATTELMRSNERLYDSLRQLSRIRITGKVQASYINDAGYFQTLFDDVYARLESAAAQLEEVTSAAALLKHEIPSMTRTGEQVQRALAA